MKPIQRIIVVTALLLACGVSAADQPPSVFVLDGAAMLANRQKLSAGDAGLRPALDLLMRRADGLMDDGPWSVMDKGEAPPSGDKHDYMSIGPYWWPDPEKPDGLPYIRNDGKVNPERHKVGDAKRFQKMQSAVVTLSHAWYFSGEEKYAQRAAMLLRTWYLDPQTRMNPHMQYAQSIPGLVEGRGIGIVDASGQPMLIDAVGLLRDSKAWTDEDQQALQEWFAQMLDWLQTSKQGKDEAKAKNNHATQYDVQVASYALFVDKPDVAKTVLAEVRDRRINTQIKGDGSQPHELSRTRSWDYCTYSLLHFTRLAQLGRHVGVDLWESAEDRPDIRDAIDYLLPYVVAGKQWEREQIRDFDRGLMLEPLLYAAPHDDAGLYAEAARDLMDKDAVERLLFESP